MITELPSPSCSSLSVVRITMGGWIPREVAWETDSGQVSRYVSDRPTTVQKPSSDQALIG